MFLAPKCRPLSFILAIGLSLDCYKILCFGNVVCFRRVEEFKEYGDMDMMMQYVKEVQTVQKKLTDSVEAIGFINEVILSICLLFLSL